MIARNRWSPLGTGNNGYRPPSPGDLIAREHGVYRVEAVIDIELDADARQVWVDAGAPNRETWSGKPYDVHLVFVGGAPPKSAPNAEPGLKGVVSVPASRFGRYGEWSVYPASGRWPQCSCCGEPMPCQAEMQDRQITAGMKQIEKFTRKHAGNCWACDERVTSRQKAVVYDGDNLDLPGGPQAQFHTRSKCRRSASAYELRWIAEDPRRERILTYPKCPGILLVHGDGSSECVGGRHPLGAEEVAPEPDCRGHLTHDHGTEAACYVGTDFFARDRGFPGCPRGCDPQAHGGTRTTRRPERRNANQLAL